MDIYATFLRAVRRHRLIEPGDRVLAAVSGGSDSVALLHLLGMLREREGAFDLEVIHLEHGVRGQAGRDDMTFVLELARERGLEAHVERRRVSAGDSRTPSEDDLRRARHAFYGRQAEECGATVVALGSTRDDQAETVLLNLTRGAGGKGLGGMEPIRPLRGDDDDLALVRPLLHLPRAELRKWLQEQSLAWRDDETNDDPRYLRNRVRAELMPLLEDLRPGAAAALARAAALLRDDESLLDALARSELEGLRLAPETDRLAPEADRLAYDATRLVELPTALARRLVRLAAAEALDQEAGQARWTPGARQVEAVLDLARERRGGQVDLGNRRIARVKGGELTFSRA